MSENLKMIENLSVAKPAGKKYANKVIQLLRPFRNGGWPVYYDTDLDVDRKWISLYEKVRPFGMSLRETGTTLYIEHELPPDEHSGEPSMVNLLGCIIRCYAHVPLIHLWWNGERWSRVTIKQLERLLRDNATRYAKGGKK